MKIEDIKTINDINTIMSNIETIILNQDSKNFKIMWFYIPEVS